MTEAISGVVSVASAAAIADAILTINKSNSSSLCFQTLQGINLDEYLFENHFLVLVGTRRCFPFHCWVRFGCSVFG